MSAETSRCLFVDSSEAAFLWGWGALEVYPVLSDKMHRKPDGIDVECRAYRRGKPVAQPTYSFYRRLCSRTCRV